MFPFTFDLHPFPTDELGESARQTIDNTADILDISGHEMIGRILLGGERIRQTEMAGIYRHEVISMLKVRPDHNLNDLRKGLERVLFVTDLKIPVSYRRTMELIKDEGRKPTKPKDGTYCAILALAQSDYQPRLVSPLKPLAL